MSTTVDTTHMRSVVLQNHFGVQNLQITQQKIPIPKSQEVLIRVSAVSLNYRDLLMIEGKYNPRLQLPFIPCSDAVGEVVAIADDVTEWKLGDRVLPLFAQKWYAGPIPQNVLKSTLGGPLDGTLREYMCVPQADLVAVPEYLSNEEACTLSCAALTAWNALAELTYTQAGQHVVCIGTGGVSLFAAQIASVLGASVSLISRSKDKIDRLRSSGLKIHHWIDSTDHPQWGKMIRRIHSADHVIEVGGAQTLEQSLQVLKAGGTISLIGILSGASYPINLLPILMRQIKVQGVFVGHKAAFQNMLNAFSLHQIKPFISHRFTLDEVQVAFQYLHNAKHIGKICITL